MSPLAKKLQIKPGKQGVEPLVLPDLGSGVRSLWSPALILFLQAIWLVIFLHTGRSSVTGARLSFHVHHERI